MIRVLCADISAVDDGMYDEFYMKASPVRQAKAGSCRQRADAVRCVAGEALLRHVLGGPVQMAASFSGKPYFPDRPDLHFNLSHSGSWVVIAIGPREVGVDVETPDRKTPREAIARRYFAEEEFSYVFREESDQNRRFLEIWTAKESYVKYLGTGIRKDLTSFSVLSLDPTLHLYRENLPDGSILCLCTNDDDYRLELLDARSLL